MKGERDQFFSFSDFKIEVNKLMVIAHTNTNFQKII